MWHVFIACCETKVGDGGCKDGDGGDGGDGEW